MTMVTDKKVYRLQFRFWLDVLRPDEGDLADYVESLKESRRFTQSIRDSLSLIRDLNAGRVGVLLSLFPWIEDYFRERFSPPATPPPLALEGLHQQLAQLQQLLAQRESLPEPSRPLRLASPTPDVPALELLTVERAAGKPSQAGRILTLQVWLASDSKNIALFKEADLELVRGHPAFNQALIQAEINRRATSQRVSLSGDQEVRHSGGQIVSPSKSQGGIKKIAGAEVELPPPDLDDLSL